MKNVYSDSYYPFLTFNSIIISFHFILMTSSDAVTSVFHDSLYLPNLNDVISHNCDAVTNHRTNHTIGLPAAVSSAARRYVCSK